MTRETKIGLLIGTAIILLVGILVSHYLSDTPKQNPPSFTNLAPDAQDALGGNATNRTPGFPAPGVGGAVLPIGPAPAPTGGRDPLLTRGHGPNDLLLNRGVVDHPGDAPDTVGDPGARAAVVHYVQPGEKLTDIAKKYYNDAGQWKLIADANRGVVYDGNKVRPNVRLVIPALPDRTASVVGGAGGPGGGSVADSGKTIKVEAGDTLGKLAGKYLGSSKYWPELLKANSDKLKDPKGLQVGMELRLPTLATAGGGIGAGTAPGTRTDGDSRPAPATGGPGVVAPPAGNGQNYVVQSGDTLSSIARKTLGSENRWKEIYDANKVALKNGPNKLTNGQSLIIPTAAASVPRGGVTTGAAAGVPVAPPVASRTGSAGA